MSLSPEINFLSLKIPSKVPYNKNGDNRFLISNSLAIIKFSFAISSFCTFSFEKYN